MTVNGYCLITAIAFYGRGKRDGRKRGIISILIHEYSLNNVCGKKFTLVFTKL